MKRLYYGIKEGKMVSINEVCSGKKCNCTCPSCGEQLIAKKGEIMVHHFAHISKKECEYGYETSLHLLAKDIIKEAKYFVLPKEKLDLYYYNGNSGQGKDYEKINPATKIIIDKVDVEHSLDNMKPDLIVYSGEKKYFVEIFVTHRIDDEKRKKIKDKGIDTIEVDLSDIGNKVEKEALSKILLEDNKKKYWVYNDKIETIISKLKKKCIIPTTVHGCAWHTTYCPINSRTYQGKSYANVNDDCIGCKYCLSITSQTSMYDHGGVICIAAENYNKKNIIDTNQAYNKYVCPKCGGRLKVKWGRFGKFLGCTRYPNCDFTDNIGVKH